MVAHFDATQPTRIGTIAPKRRSIPLNVPERSVRRTRATMRICCGSVKLLDLMLRMLAMVWPQRFDPVTRPPAKIHAQRQALYLH